MSREEKAHADLMTDHFNRWYATLDRNNILFSKRMSMRLIETVTHGGHALSLIEVDDMLQDELFQQITETKLYKTTIDFLSNEKNSLKVKSKIIEEFWMNIESELNW